MEADGDNAAAAERRSASEVWLSRRALTLHGVILVVVPGFMALCVWQLSRALGGNELSWAYVFEWPLFAGYAVYMWWRLVHERPVAAGAATQTDAPAPGPGAENAPGEGDRGDRSEDPELTAYNEYLARLAEQDRAAGR
jgi:hypothetical protein